MSLIDVALEAAQAAGRLIVQAHHARDPVAEHKGAVDLVTQTDRDAEQAIRDVLARHTPGIPVMGEEGGGGEGASTRWVVDPIDGTTNFVHGFPWFCVSIALEDAGASQVGVVLDPLRDHAYHATLDQGAWLGERRLRVSATPHLADALIATGFPYDRHSQLDTLLDALRRVLRQCRGIRRAGSAALDLAMVASGNLDAYWERKLHPWDIAAGRLLVTEAGGRITDHHGEPLRGDRPCPLASNGALHEELLEVLALVAN